MSIEIQRSRLVAFAVLALVATHLFVLATVFGERLLDMWLYYKRFVAGPWGDSSTITARQVGDAIKLAAWPYFEEQVDGRRVWIPIALLHIVLTMLLVPLAYKALPQTLRRAKVRPEHFLRISLYAFAALPIVLALWTAVLWIICRGSWHIVGAFTKADFSESLGTLGKMTRNNDGAILTCLAFPWLWRWWSVATRDYLKLPHSRSVAAAMLLIAGIVAALLILSVPLFRGLWLGRVSR
jgi:hypothetical protein